MATDFKPSTIDQHYPLREAYYLRFFGPTNIPQTNSTSRSLLAYSHIKAYFIKKFQMIYINSSLNNIKKGYIYILYAKMLIYIYMHIYVTLLY